MKIKFNLLLLVTIILFLLFLKSRRSEGKKKIKLNQIGRKIQKALIPKKRR